MIEVKKPMLTEKFIKSSPTSKLLFSISTIIIVAVSAYNWVVSPQTSLLHAAQRHRVMMSSATEKATMIRKRVNPDRLCIPTRDSSCFINTSAPLRRLPEGVSWVHERNSYKANSGRAKTKE